MRSRLKRMLAVMLIAAMTTIPAVSSLAAETEVSGFSPFTGFEGEDPSVLPSYPFDASLPFWPWFNIGMASPSNMLPGFIPGMDQGFWANPQDPAGTFPDGSENPWGDFGGADDTAFAPEEPFFPGIVPPADMEDAYDVPYESVDETDSYTAATDTEAEDDAFVMEEDNWTTVDEDDEDSGNGDYVKPVVFNIDGRMSSAAMLTDYIDRLFYGEPDTTLFTDYWRSILNADEQNLYDDVKDFVQEIAASDEIYPVYDAEGSARSVRLTKGQLGLSDDTKNIAWCEAALDYYEENVLDVRQVINYLYRDNPSYFYWADGSYLVLYNATVEDDYCIITPSSIYFPPGSDWEGSYAGRLGSYEVLNVDNEDILIAAKAAENAWEIVEDHIEEPESDMMASFGEAIAGIISCDSAEYADSSDYDDPWMLVYVFDKDPLTTVTDTAYSKALLCLREMSGIDKADTDAE